MDNLFNKISDLYKVFLKQETAAAKPKRVAAYKKKEEEQAKKEALRKERLRTTGMALIELAAIRENERKLREDTCTLFGFNKGSYNGLTDSQKAKATAALLLSRKTEPEVVMDITGLSKAMVDKIDLVRLRSGFTQIKRAIIFSSR
jgi:hypothetical protein